MLLEDPESDRLAYEVVKRNIITDYELCCMIDKLTSSIPSEPLEMCKEDILVLYTIMELNMRLMLSDKGDEIRSDMRHAQSKNSFLLHPNDVSGFENMMSATAKFIRSVTEEYYGDPVFVSRRKLVEELNEYI